MAQLFGLVITHVRRGARASLLLLLLTAAGAACGGSDDDADPGAVQCVPEPTAPCMPDINTTFDSVYQNLLAKRCGTTGTACHGSAGHQGNLVLGDADTAYKALLGQDGTHARVIPSDPNCSALMERLESDDDAFRMPRGEAKLGEGSRCAVRMWIESGAAR